jgi:O-antigen ligase
LRWLAFAMLAVMALQLLPLPSGVWTHLPGREVIARNFALIGRDAPWLALSLDPEASLRALLALLPPLAVMAATLVASARGRVLAMGAVVGMALASLAVGVAQILSGGAEATYPYAITNLGSAVGLFANRNHLATLMIEALPAAAALAATGAAVIPGWIGARGWIVACVPLALGPLLTGSVAGAALLVPALAGSAGILLALVPAARRANWRRALIAACAMIAVAGGTWAAVQIMHPAAVPASVAEQHRPFLVATTLRAARDNLPFGTGGGSFPSVYPAYQQPSGVSPEYANHAHSDYAEVLLDYGLPGALIVIAVFGWWLWRVRALWIAADASGSDASDAVDPLARAGVVMVGLVLAHSVVDYPLRTAAIATVTAFAAALAARPVTQVASRRARQVHRDSIKDSIKVKL